MNLRTSTLLLVSIVGSILQGFGQQGGTPPSEVRPESKTFTAPEEFTGNCEGPAVDADGNIYAVNFAQDGTIAQITRRGKTSFFITLPKGSTDRKSVV